MKEITFGTNLKRAIVGGKDVGLVDWEPIPDTCLHTRSELKELAESIWKAARAHEYRQAAPDFETFISSLIKQ
jgi:hypothetical protein